MKRAYPILGRIMPPLGRTLLLIARIVLWLLWRSIVITARATVVLWRWQRRRQAINAQRQRDLMLAYLVARAQRSWWPF